MKYLAITKYASAGMLLVGMLTLFSTGCTTSKQTPADGSDATLNWWLTTRDRSLLLAHQPTVQFAASAGSLPTLQPDSAKTFQTMEGFGFTLTGGSAVVINGMSAPARKQLLDELFGNGDHSIGISYLRISIGASDLNDTVFTYDDLPAGQTDTALRYFSLRPDSTQLIPLLQDIKKINPAIKILGSPWSPPSWMKDNDSSKGGSLKKEFYPTYARYFVKYIQAMQQAGISIDAITPQNEPLHPGNNPSMLMLAADQADFIKNHLGPAFATAGIQTKIFIYDHNCDRPDYPLTILADKDASRYVDGSAFHLYAGDIGALSQVHDAHPDKNVYFTEQYTAINSDFAGDILWHVKNLVIGAPNNWARTVLEWNLANDKNFGPYTPGGCTTCKGALTIDGDQITRNVAYYIIGHASKFVEPGAWRVGINSVDGLSCAAFRTKENKMTLIVLNETNAVKNFNIRSGDRYAPLSLPAGAVASCTW